MKVNGEKAIDMLLALNKDFIKDFLKDHNLKVGGNKATLKDRLLEAYKKKKIKLNDIVKYIDEKEGWGNLICTP